MTTRIPASIIDSAKQTRQLIELPVADTLDEILANIEDLLKVGTDPIRICIPSLGLPRWGDSTPDVRTQLVLCFWWLTYQSQTTLSFVFRVRRLLRLYTHACACISLASFLCTDAWGGPGWTQKLGWVSDSSITLSAFTGKSD